MYRSYWADFLKFLHNYVARNNESNLVSLAPDERDDDEDDAAEDVAHVAEDVAEVVQTGDGILHGIEGKDDL